MVGSWDRLISGAGNINPPINLENRSTFENKTWYTFKKVSLALSIPAQLKSFHMER